MNPLSQIQSGSHQSQRASVATAPAFDPATTRESHAHTTEESARAAVDALLDHVLPMVPALTACLERGIDVLDIGCGAGRTLVELAFTYPQSRFTGYNSSAHVVAAARAEADRRRIDNVVFEVIESATLDEPGGYALVTAFDACDAHRQPERMLRDARQSLRPGGVFLMCDARFATHRQGGAPSDVDRTCAMLRQAGFGQITVKTLPHDPTNYYYVMPV